MVSTGDQTLACEHMGDKLVQSSMLRWMLQNARLLVCTSCIHPSLTHLFVCLFVCPFAEESDVVMHSFNISRFGDNIVKDKQTWQIYVGISVGHCVRM